MNLPDMEHCKKRLYNYYNTQYTTDKAYMNNEPNIYTNQPPASTTHGVLHDIAVEESLLGTLLWNAEKFFDIIEIVETEAFYAPRNRNIFEAMHAISKQGEAIDSVTVNTRLAATNQLEAIGGSEYLTQLIGKSPSYGHLESYAKIIQDKYTRRRLQTAGASIGKLSIEGEKEVEHILDE